jgi:hypothetical protein
LEMISSKDDGDTALLIAYALLGIFLIHGT